MKTKELQGGPFLTVFRQICVPYVLCRFSPHSMAPSTSIKYFATFAVLVLQYARMLTNYKEYTIR